MSDLADRLAAELRDALAEAENGNASGAMCYVDRAQEIWEEAKPSVRDAEAHVRRRAREQEGAAK